MYSPLKSEEKIRELILKKNLNPFFQKSYEEKMFNFLLNLMKNTRFNEISDLLRTFNEEKNWIKNLVTTYGFDGIRIDTIPVN